MRVVITGGAGFLGKLLAAKILQRGAFGFSGQPQRERACVGRYGPATGESWLADPRVSQVVGDIADRAVLAKRSPQNTQHFHLAAGERSS